MSEAYILQTTHRGASYYLEGYYRLGGAVGVTGTFDPGRARQFTGAELAADEAWKKEWKAIKRD